MSTEIPKFPKIGIADGSISEFSVAVTVDPAVSSVSESESITAAAGDFTVAAQYDINVTKKIVNTADPDNPTHTNITELSAPITLTFPAPEFIPSNVTVGILHTHEESDGSFTTTFLPDEDDDPATVTVTVSALSIFTLVYTEQSSSEPTEPPIYILPKKYEITASAGVGGTISPEGVSQITSRRDITYTITPNEGYVVVSVSIDGIDMGAITTYTFERVRADHTISATFAKAPWVNPYTDVASDAPYYADVEFVTEAGLMQGIGDNIFAPDMTLNRATLVTILWRQAGKPIVESPAPFTDIPDDWYTQEDEILTANLPPYTYSAWAENDVIRADMYGIVKDGADDLTKAITRADAAGYLNRLLTTVLVQSDGE